VLGVRILVHVSLPAAAQREHAPGMRFASIFFFEEQDTHAYMLKKHTHIGMGSATVRGQ